MDQLNMSAWVGRDTREVGHDVRHGRGPHPRNYGPSRCKDAPSDGTALPGLWHWCAFPPLTHANDLGRDGHPGPGMLLPPISYSRRMWAGGALRFHGPLGGGRQAHPAQLRA